MASSPDSFLEYDQSNGSSRTLDFTLDCAISGLKKCLYEYQEKTKENSKVLEKLGWDNNLLSQDIRKDLKDIFSDSEVFSIDNECSKEVLRINPWHILDSLTVNKELAEVQALKVQIDSTLAQLQFTNHKLFRKLELEKTQAQALDEKINERTAEGTMFKGKLERLQWDVKHLMQEAQELERPKFSLEEIHDMNNELNKLESEVAMVKTKLEKYNNLPLTDKEAAKQLAKLQEELTNVKNEISLKVAADF